MSTSRQRRRRRRVAAKIPDSVKALKMLGAKYFTLKRRVRDLGEELRACTCREARRLAFVRTWLRNCWRRRQALRSMNRILGPRKFQGRYEDLREVEYLERHSWEMFNQPREKNDGN